jgi:hypothetical protein
MNNPFANPKPDFNPNTMFELKSDINELSLQLALSVIGLTMSEFRTMDKNQIKRILHHCNHSERLAYEILLHHLDYNTSMIRPTKVFVPDERWPQLPLPRNNEPKRFSPKLDYHDERRYSTRKPETHNYTTEKSNKKLSSFNNNNNIDDAYDHWTKPKSNKTLLNNMVDDAYDYWV